MTSNLGSGVSDRDEMMQQVKAYFPPEFINRIDEIVHFNPLSMQDLQKILDVQLGEINARLSASKKLEIAIDQEAREELCTLGFDPEWGARPLKRTFQHRVLDRVAVMVLQGELEPGSKICVSSKDLTVKKC